MQRLIKHVCKLVFGKENDKTMAERTTKHKPFKPVSGGKDRKWMFDWISPLQTLSLTITEPKQRRALLMLPFTQTISLPGGQT